MSKMKHLIGIMTGIALAGVLVMFPAFNSRAAEGVEINETNFPAVGFRNYISNNFDKNKDGILSNEEREAVKSISYYKMPGTGTLAGIEFFPNLIYLSCSCNDLTSLDVSKNTKLESLYCFGNSIPYLDLSNNPNLNLLDLPQAGFDIIHLGGLENLADFDMDRYYTYTWGNPKGEPVSCRCYYGDKYKLYIDEKMSFDFEYFNPGTEVTETENGDWLEPLRTQLRIAADPEFGANVNNTADYTGDFALPAEIMQYIKDNPQVTLNYSFYVDDVLRTVTITGKNVVVEEGVLYYGFNYLLSHYGDGSAVTGPTGIYTIVKGDTLTSIAKKFGTTIEALATKNGIKNVDLIYAGAKIAY